MGSRVQVPLWPAQDLGLPVTSSEENPAHTEIKTPYQSHWRANVGVHAELGLETARWILGYYCWRRRLAYNRSMPEGFAKKKRKRAGATVLSALRWPGPAEKLRKNPETTSAGNWNIIEGNGAGMPLKELLEAARTPLPRQIRRMWKTRDWWNCRNRFRTRIRTPPRRNRF